MATALGHAAVRRRYSVTFTRTDVLLKRLRASRLDNSHDAEIRKLVRVDLLVLDDFALQPIDALDTADIYELIVERHRASSTVVTSNREPVEWLGQLSDTLLAQSAIDRLKSAAYELVLEGESYRATKNQPSPSALLLPGLAADAALDLYRDSRHHQSANTGYPVRWSHQPGARVDPSSWRANRSGRVG